MSLKEDWTSQDKFNYNDMNDIITKINEIDNKLLISSPFISTGEKRNIKVGDDLSGKMIYLEFPNDLYEDILNDVVGGQDNIITTGSHSIIEYSNLYNSVATVSIDSWMDMIYQANIDTSEVYSNLTEIQLSNEFGIVTNINSNLSAYKYIFLIEAEEVEMKRGDFITSELLQLIENNVDKIAKAVNTSFKKRDWYYLSVITYEDINRWAIVLNIAENAVFEGSKNIVTEDEEYLLTENSDYLITEGS